MEQNLPLLALGAVALTALLSRATLSWLGLRRRLAAAFLAGLALPLSATSAAFVYVVVQPASQQPGAGMFFAMIALLSLYAVPLCLFASLFAVFAFRHRA
jgi:hypothetical protein